MFPLPSSNETVQRDAKLSLSIVYWEDFNWLSFCPHEENLQRLLPTTWTLPTHLFSRPRELSFQPCQVSDGLVFTTWRRGQDRKPLKPPKQTSSGAPLQFKLLPTTLDSRAPESRVFRKREMSPVTLVIVPEAKKPRKMHVGFNVLLLVLLYAWILRSNLEFL